MKRVIRKFARQFGYDIIKFQNHQMGILPFYDMSKFVKSKNPVLFDIGANVGQTVKDFKEVFNSSTIHAFEPSPTTFKILSKNTSNYHKLHLWNYGVGSNPKELFLNEYAFSNMNSFFDIHKGESIMLKNKVAVKVVTIDSFVKNNNIETIDVLKIDTEGFEFEVLKGAIDSISRSKIGMLFIEAHFLSKHKDIPSFTTLWDFIIKNDFELVAIYPLVYRNNMGIYTNILFKHKGFN